MDISTIVPGRLDSDVERDAALACGIYPEAPILGNWRPLSSQFQAHWIKRFLRMTLGFSKEGWPVARVGNHKASWPIVEGLCTREEAERIAIVAVAAQVHAEREEARRFNRLILAARQQLQTA